MATSADVQGCSGSRTNGTGNALLPAVPFYAPRYHFGMLLGVDDFESEQAYHRGKMRLHNGWLHREGVVWGLAVDAPPVEGGDGSLRGEIRVQPGLALDAAGRELYLAATACVGVGAWYDAHKDDPDLKAAVATGEDGTITFDAHVVARFRACLSRQVPAISEPCVGAGGDTAYSRAQETVELLLLPGLAPARTYPYHRLRLLFALEEARVDEDGNTLPADQEVLDARAAILALTSGQPAAYLQAFRRFAALDEIDLAPATTEDGDVILFPAEDDTEVTLADVRGITLVPNADGGYDLTDLQVDNTVRPSHVATATIQELLCGPVFAGAAEAEGGGPPPSADAAPDAGGPRVDRASVRLEGEAVTFTVNRPLSKASVARHAFSISAFDNRDGWHDVEVVRDPVLDRSAKKVRLELATGFGGNLVRIIAHGTGPYPLLGTNLVPLAGEVGGAPGWTTDGIDFVHMLKRSET